MTQNQNKVYRLTKTEGYENIKCFSEPIPEELGKDEVLMKIKAVSLNYRDLLISKSTYVSDLKDQVIPCSDGAGEVFKVGSGVRGFEAGNRDVSTYDPIALSKLPADSHLTYEETAALVCTGITVWNCLYGSGDKFVAGQSVLTLGTGGVAMATLILAKAAGAVTIITSSSDKKLKYVKEKYGVDHTVNYKAHPDWEEEVLAIAGGEGVDHVIENGGAGSVEKSIASVKQGATVSLVGVLSQADGANMPSLAFSILMKAATVRGVIIDSKQLFEELLRFVHAKKLRMPIESVFGSSEEEVNTAYKNVKSQLKIGKTVIKFD